MIIGERGAWSEYAIPEEWCLVKPYMRLRPVLTHGQMDAGYWESECGEFEWHYGCDEVIQILHGAALLCLDGTTEWKRVGPGAVVSFKRGTIVYWRVVRPIRKFFVIRRPTLIDRIIGVFK